MRDVIPIMNAPVVEIERKTKCLRDSIIGNYDKFTGPYGDKPIIYADWTASGRCIKGIENYMAETVLPLYGNTHTKTSISGNQTTHFRNDAREIIIKAINATHADDVVVFTGNGSTGAIQRLTNLLRLNEPREPMRDNSHIPIVFTSCYEHHSNLLGWRECHADVVTVQYSPYTGVCLIDLSRLLTLYASRKIKIGSFSAASNVTGVLTATNDVSILMHRANGWAFFDYASAAPYIDMNMNPPSIGSESCYSYKDAIFFSGHKFIGGPGTPGVLAFKKSILPKGNHPPSVPGGGTVQFVSAESTIYVTNYEEREEAGTPNILGDIRLGLAFLVKESFSSEWIEEEEERISRYGQTRLTADNRIKLIGRTGGWKSRHLPIFSFLIRRGSRFLHFNFVSALLNDLFGIQTRGGCACAGPFSSDLLGMTTGSIRKLEDAVINNEEEVMKPGYCRFSLTFWMSLAEIDYILDAVLFVAEHGWRFLKQYRFATKTAEWAHSSRFGTFSNCLKLNNFDFIASTECSLIDSVTPEQTRPLQNNLASVWGVGSLQELLTNMTATVHAEVLVTHTCYTDTGFSKDKLLSDEMIRWFVLASDAEAEDVDCTALPLAGLVRPSNGPSDLLLKPWACKQCKFITATETTPTREPPSRQASFIPTEHPDNKKCLKNEKSRFFSRFLASKKLSIAKATAMPHSAV